MGPRIREDDGAIYSGQQYAFAGMTPPASCHYCVTLRLGSPPAGGLLAVARVT
jgi:hypothetical protein